MPIPALHRERIDLLLDAHEYALNDPAQQKSPTKTMIHRTLLKLGRNKRLLELVDDVIDSADLADRIRYDAQAVLSERGVVLPAGARLTAIQPAEAEAAPILRVEFDVRTSVMLVEYDPQAGVSTRLAVDTRRSPDGLSR